MPLEQAARSGYSNVVSVLLDLGGKATTRVLETAAGNWESGKDVMALLLDRRRDEITISETVVKAAARNRWSGEDVMALLLDRRGDEIIQTPGEVRAGRGDISTGAGGLCEGAG